VFLTAESKSKKREEKLKVECLETRLLSSEVQTILGALK